MKITVKKLIFMMLVTTMAMSCTNNGISPVSNENDSVKTDDFNYFSEQFGDLKILRYQIPGFETLTLQQKKLVYYLSEAALCGRDILWDQKFKYNLKIRKLLENIIETYQGDKNTDDYKNFMVYAKRVFFSNGIHHHYSTDKFLPECSKEYFTSLITNLPADKLPLSASQTKEAFINEITTIIYDTTLYAKGINQTEGKDMVQSSACNFYEGVSQAEVEAYYKQVPVEDTLRPVSVGLNSKVVKENGKVTEEVYKLGGLYSAAIEKIISWLEKAKEVAETDVQKNEIALLIEYYKTGDLKTWDKYNVTWAGNTNVLVDYVNGFIENYGDPMGMKATWEGIANFKDLEASKRTQTISDNAQWFEDNSPIDKQFKKESVVGVSAKVIIVAQLGGDCYPATPIGINLPNADWIRKDYGSKSVTISNITEAYEKVLTKSGFLEEFVSSQEEIDRVRKYNSVSDNLHTDLHECLGHGSGKLLPETDPNALKNYASALEESRADLFALYYMNDSKIFELGLLPNEDAAKAAYDGYIRNGLMTQLARIVPGNNIEQAHMRCRMLIAKWCFENGKKDNVIEMFTKDGKTFVKINDYQKLKALFGLLLSEIQRIKSTGDFEAGKSLVETYAVKVDRKLNEEIRERYQKLNLAPYTGFINPTLKPVVDANGQITDITIEYNNDYLGQMMYYGKQYGFLPVEN